MAVNRPQTTRAQSGRSLVLLGVVLALLAGVLVLYVVNHYTSVGLATEQVVVAQTMISEGTIIDMSQSDTTHMTISQAFTVTTVNVGALVDNPSVYHYTSQDALNAYLNERVVVQNIYPGDFLRQPDLRIVPIGSTTPGSLTLFNQTKAAGMLIAQIQVSGAPPVVPGDTVDILVTECDISNGAPTPTIIPGCTTQVTLTDVFVYAVQGSSVYVVLSLHDALDLKYLLETGKVSLVLRGPGVTDPARGTTPPVNGGSIIKEFGF